MTLAVIQLRDKFKASRGASEADLALVKDVNEAALELDAIDRAMFFRRSNEADAANDKVLASIRRVANDLLIAADEYEFSL